MIPKPKHKPTDQTRRTVRSLSGIGIDKAQIATILDISPDDLATLYAKDLLAGPAEADAKVRSALFTKAIAGDVAAIDLWRKMQPGFF